MAIPSRTDSIWVDIISGEKEFDFEFLAIKIFIGLAQFQYKSTPDVLQQLAEELYNVFDKNQDIPAVQRDLQKLNEEVVASPAFTGLLSLAELEKLIAKGGVFLLAGDEGLLKNVPRGNWIGGSIPYFIASEGGVISKDKIFVTEISGRMSSFEIRSYNEHNIENIYTETPIDGYSFLILPASSPVHFSFALNAPKYKDFATRPIVGWVAGVHLSELGKVTPKTINGKTGECSDTNAVVMRCSLPHDMACDMNIVNIFSQGKGDVIEVLEEGFSIKEALVNGKQVNFADYVLENKLDLRLPLVANYYGININVSFQNVDKEKKVVNVYAPLFKGVQYKHAEPVSDYIKDFMKRLPENNGDIIFSCNCILNFVYAELEGRTCGVVGPVTFGEIAYQLLNQTMVYLAVYKNDGRSSRSNEAVGRQLQERTQELKRVKDELAASHTELGKMLPKMEVAFTELKQLQRRLSDVIDSLPDPTYVIDLEGKVIFWNHSMELMTGVKACDMIGKGNYEYALPFYGQRRPTLLDLCMGWIDEEAIATMFPEVKRDGNILTLERFLPHLGQGIHVWVKAVPLYDVDGKVVCAIETVRDITVRKIAEDALKQAYADLKSIQDQLIQSEKMASIGVLAAGVAHEINNPLGFIGNNMELLGQYFGEYTKILSMMHILKGNVEKGNIEEAKATILEIEAFEKEIKFDFVWNDLGNLLQDNQRGVERIQKIVTDLRTFAHEGHDGEDLIQIEAIINGVIGIIHAELKYKIELKIDYGKTSLVKCDPQRMGQVFINLLVNAAQAIEGKGIIEVKTYTHDQYVCVDVRDSGGGINEEHLKRVFEPFYTTKPVGKGTGLGLSVSYGIIKRYGGEIKVRSKMGEGTTFTVMLPASP